MHWMYFARLGEVRTRVFRATPCAMNKALMAVGAVAVSCMYFVGACSAQTAATSPGGGVDAGTDAVAPRSDAGATLATSWYATGKPFADRYCRSCHGGQGPGVGDFTRYENVVALAPAMLAAVTSGRMPPGASDPACRDYANSDRRFVSAEGRASFAKWVADGTPKGEPNGEVAVAELDETIANPDLVIKAPAAYAPTYSNPNEPGNEYRCFALRPGLTSNKYITALAPVLDKRAMVHHIVAYRMAPDHLPAAGKSYPEDGWSCIDMVNAGVSVTGDPRQSDGMIVAWAPGTGAFNFPAGTGLSLKSTDVVVLQIHYFASGRVAAGTKDQTGFAFKLVDSVPTPIAIAPVGKSAFTIPAGDPAYSLTGSFGPVALPLTIYGTMPHMHVLGTGYELSVRNVDASQNCVAKADRYEFANQVTYLFKNPVVVPAGAKVDFRCTWDNSAANPNQFYTPPVAISYGERTDQEMCYAFTLIGLGN